jgi:hypothetical protein
LSLSNEKISDFINKIEKEAKALREESLRYCWYMRGGLTYDQAMMLSASEREFINKIVKDNLETTKKSGLPFF